MKDADIFKHGGEVLYGHWAGLLVIGLFMISDKLFTKKLYTVTFR